MREFIDAFGEIVDLDDKVTYDYLPDTSKELRDLMFSEIGFAHWYMNYHHPEIFKGHEQEARVKKLIKQFTDGYRKTIDTPIWLKEQIYLFQDETENMC